MALRRAKPLSESVFTQSNSIEKSEPTKIPKPEGKTRKPRTKRKAESQTIMPEPDGDNATTDAKRIVAYSARISPQTYSVLEELAHASGHSLKKLLSHCVTSAMSALRKDVDKGKLKSGSALPDIATAYRTSASFSDIELKFIENEIDPLGVLSRSERIARVLHPYLVTVVSELESRTAASAK